MTAVEKALLEYAESEEAVEVAFAKQPPDLPFAECPAAWREEWSAVCARREAAMQRLRTLGVSVRETYQRAS